MYVITTNYILTQKNLNIMALRDKRKGDFMRKMLLLVVFLLIFIYACQPKTDAMQKPSETQAQQPAAE